jgi:hypothetical protein
MLFSERPKVTCRGGSPNGARTESNGSVHDERDVIKYSA